MTPDQIAGQISEGANAKREEITGLRQRQKGRMVLA